MKYNNYKSDQTTILHGTIRGIGMSEFTSLCKVPSHLDNGCEDASALDTCSIIGY